MTTQCTISVRYPDCDAMGIVHHAVYPIWYEIARMDHFCKLGVPYTDTHALGVDPAMVSLNLTYAAPVRFPGEVTVRTRLLSCAPKKLEFSYEVYQEGDEKPRAAGTSFHIWTGPDLKSYNMEENYPEAWERIQQSMLQP